MTTKFKYLMWKIVPKKIIVIWHSIKRWIVFRYGVNFSASTHVYANYNCTVFKRDDGLNRISYFSGDTLTINDVNT